MKASCSANGSQIVPAFGLATRFDFLVARDEVAHGPFAHEVVAWGMQCNGTLNGIAMGIAEVHRCFTLTSRSGVAGWPGPDPILLRSGRKGDSRDRASAHVEITREPHPRGREARSNE